MANKKIRVGIIFGGRSGEHEVSLMSARSVMNAIDKSKYEVLPIGITKEGRWLVGEDIMRMLADGANAPVTHAALVGEPGQRALVALDDEQGGRAMAAHELTELDVIFPVLHGPFGEDGTVQGLLELAEMPYVGAGVVGSAVGMDKAIFKAVMQSHGLPVLPYRLVLRLEWERDRETVLDAVEAELTYPVFVKPANLGSSVGVNKAQNRDELAAGLDDAARYDRRLLVEQGINAREIEVSVLGNEEPIASVPGEVVPDEEFYSYASKYLNDASELSIPAPISEELSAQAREMAVRAYKAMDCAGLGRCDFLLDKDDGTLYMNEINSIPGFTHISMYPKLWEASGISYPDLIDRLISLALERGADKRRSETSYQPAGG
jgi:D-alanine-D-alanine ligase